MDGLSTVRANKQHGAAEYAPDERGEIIMKNSNRYPLNLQFFGEQAADPAKPADPAAAPAKPADPAADSAKPAEPPKPPMFAEMLKDKGFASDLDKHVAKAITTAKTKWDEEAKLTEAELAKKRQAESEEKLSKREAELAARELRADMLAEISKRSLPHALIDAVSLADADTAVKSLDALEKAYRAAVDAGVTEKLKGTPPPDGAGGGSALADKLRAAAGVKPKK